MGDVKKIKELLIGQKPVEWDQFPDIAMYMDQIVSYMSRQFPSSGKDEKITSAMVNNYIKDGLLPRADGKKYSSEHIAKLTAIVALKQVLPVKNIQVLMKKENQLGDAKEFYENFCEDLRQGLENASRLIPDEISQEELGIFASRLAISAYCQRLLCRKLIALMEKAGTEEKKSK